MIAFNRRSLLEIGLEKRICDFFSGIIPLCKTFRLKRRIIFSFASVWSFLVTLIAISLTLYHSSSKNTSVRAKEKKNTASERLESKMAEPTRLELATSAVTGQRSNQLSYDSTLSHYISFRKILQDYCIVKTSKNLHPRDLECAWVINRCIVYLILHSWLCAQWLRYRLCHWSGWLNRFHRQVHSRHGISSIQYIVTCRC